MFHPFLTRPLPLSCAFHTFHTSHQAPVTTHKLYNDVKNYKDLDHFETPYVVKFHRHYLLAPTQVMEAL